MLNPIAAQPVVASQHRHSHALAFILMNHPDARIPRPSHYYGRRHQSSMAALLHTNREPDNATATAAPPMAPASPIPTVNKIDKSQLAIAEPKRLRDKAHLKFVASQPCLVCGRSPSDPHHLRFAQPRAIGLKVSDEFTVPLMPWAPSRTASSRQ